MDYNNSFGSDYENIKLYLENNDQQAFNRLYHKYFKYCLAAANKIYKLSIPYSNSLGIPDIAGELFEKCFLQTIRKTRLKDIQPNYDLKPRLAGYLMAYTKSMMNHITKYGYIVPIESILDRNGGEITKEITIKLSYDPTESYIENIQNAKVRLMKKLNRKEILFVQYAEEGKTLKEISEKIDVPFGSMGAFKNKLKQKCKTILEIQ